MGRTDIAINSPSARILRALMREGGLSTAQLAGLIRRSVPSTSRVLVGMQSRRLIRREADGRSWRWFVMAVGRKVAK